MSLALLAAAFFVSVSAGGAFFHDHIHHHASQHEHHDCPVYQLTAQALILVAAIAAFIFYCSVANLPARPKGPVVVFTCILPPLRAPPTSL